MCPISRATLRLFSRCRPPHPNAEPTGLRGHMHARPGLSLLAALILCSSSSITPAQVTPAQDRMIGGVGLTLFADPNFRGRTATLRDDTADLRSIGMNDVARSVRVGPGEQWEVCEHINFEGRCVVVSGAEADLRTTRWDRRISSARRIGDGGGRGIRPPIQPLPPNLELFSRTGFSGDRRAFSGPQADLRRV